MEVGTEAMEATETMVVTEVVVPVADTDTERNKL